MQEQRLTVRLRGYWDLLRKGEPLPDTRKFNSVAIADVWPYCYRVRVEGRNHLSYTYDYMGRPIAELYGRDLTGLTVDGKTGDFPGSVIHKKFDEVVQKAQPVLDDGHLINQQGKMLKYRACLLPFGNAREGVNSILVGLSCRVF